MSGALKRCVCGGTSVLEGFIATDPFIDFLYNGNFFFFFFLKKKREKKRKSGRQKRQRAFEPASCPSTFETLICSASVEKSIESSVLWRTGAVFQRNPFSVDCKCTDKDNTRSKLKSSHANFFLLFVSNIKVRCCAMVQLASTSAVPLRECMARLHRHSRQTLSKKKISNQIIMHILKETENEPRRGNGSLAKGVQRWYTISGRSEQVNCVIATSVKGQWKGGLTSFLESDHPKPSCLLQHLSIPFNKSPMIQSLAPRFSREDSEERVSQRSS